jgi:hypothetical protein
MAFYFWLSLYVFWSAQEFCSVGDDSCLILWDARTGTSPAIKVICLSFIFLVLLLASVFVNFSWIMVDKSCGYLWRHSQYWWSENLISLFWMMLILVCTIPYSLHLTVLTFLFIYFFDHNLSTLIGCRVLIKKLSYNFFFNYFFLISTSLSQSIIHVLYAFLSGHHSVVFCRLCLFTFKISFM